MDSWGATERSRVEMGLQSPGSSVSVYLRGQLQTMVLLTSERPGPLVRQDPSLKASRVEVFSWGNRVSGGRTPLLVSISCLTWAAGMVGIHPHFTDKDISDTELGGSGSWRVWGPILNLLNCVCLFPHDLASLEAILCNSGLEFCSNP